jgi:hypothetical protein
LLLLQVKLVHAATAAVGAFLFDTLVIVIFVVVLIIMITLVHIQEFTLTRFGPFKWVHQRWQL